MTQRTCVVTAQPHAYVRFRRAIERRALWLAEDVERFIEGVRGDGPEAAAMLRIAERELEAGGLN